MADEDTPYLQSSQYGNYYAESKSAAEQLILAENCPPKFSTCALRLRGIYGPGEVKNFFFKFILIKFNFRCDVFNVLWYLIFLF